MRRKTHISAPATTYDDLPIAMRLPVGTTFLADGVYPASSRWWMRVSLQVVLSSLGTCADTKRPVYTCMFKIKVSHKLFKVDQ